MQQTRRRFLGAAAGAGALSLAGCLGGGGSGIDPAECSTAKADPVQSLPAPVVGDPDSSVTVVAFEDYACPHCATYSLEVFPSIKRRYVDTGEIRYEFRDFPIPVSEQWSYGVANAARSVQEQAGPEAYFEFEKLAFENQGSYSMSLLSELGEQVGTAGCGVRHAAEAGTYRPVLDADRELGVNEYDVPGTPAVYVNGRRVNASVSGVSRAIEAAKE